MMETLNQAREGVASESPGTAWDWDPRFACGIRVVEASQFPAVEGALKQTFADHWTADNIQNAPHEVQQLAEAGGGLRPGQQIFCTSIVADQLAYAAWWPWSGNKRVSVRLGVFGQEADSIGDELKAALAA